MTSSKPIENRSTYDRFLDLLAHICTVISGLALVFLTVSFGWLVYGRYVLNSTPTWVEQSALLLIVLIGFLSAAVGIHQGTHLSVTYFVTSSPHWLQRLFILATHIILAVFGTVMMIYSYQLVLFKWGSKIPLIHLPEGLRAVPIMISGGLILLFSVGHIIHFFRDAPAPPSDNRQD